MSDKTTIARGHIVNLRQCALFVDSEPIRRAMTDAADFIECLNGIEAAITAYLASRPGLWFVEKDGSMRAPTTKDI